MSDMLKKEIPDGWKMQSVKSLGKAITGNTPPTKDSANYGGEIPFIKPTELIDRPVWVGRETISKKGAEKARILPIGGVLVSCIGNLGKTAIAKREVAFNQQINAVVFNEAVTPKYGFYYFQTAKFRKDLELLASATTISIVNKSKFESIYLPIAPIEQQKQIVAKIEKLFSHIDAGIEALNTAKQRLKQYRQSVLKAAVTGELSKEWREANKSKLEPASKVLLKIEEVRNNWIEEQIQEGNKEASRLRNKLKKHQFDELDTSIIPNEWVSVSLTKLCLLVVDCHNKTAPYVEEGIPLIRTSNIKEGAINFHKKMKYVTQETYDFWSRRCPPNAGDIFLTREAPMGESAIVPKTPKVCMGQRMMLLRVIHELTDVEYLHFAIMEPLFQKRIHKFKVGMGVQHLRVGDVEKLVIAMPSLEEQKVIVRKTNDKLELINRLEKEIDIQLLKASKTKQSILASAFSGKLTATPKGAE